MDKREKASFNALLAYELGRKYNYSEMHRIANEYGVTVDEMKSHWEHVERILEIPIKPIKISGT